MGVNSIKFFDRFLGSIICIVLGILNIFRKKQDKPPNEILILQFWGIGETILTIPAIKALRLKFKSSKITILATDRNKDVYESSNFHDELKLIDLDPLNIIRFMFQNEGKYDLVIDMEEYLNISSIISFFVGKSSIGYSHGLRSLLYTERIKYNDKQHASLTFYDLVKQLGVTNNFSKLEKLTTDKEDQEVMGTLLKKLNIKPKDLVVGITPGSAESARSRMWPGTNFAKLADQILDRYKSRILFIGSGNERTLIENIRDSMKNKDKSYNLAGRISLKQSFYLIEKCKLFISNDTGPMHIAAAQETKTIGLFGPNLPQRFGPFGKGNIAIYKGEVCKYSPCINVHRGKVPDCLYKKRSGNYQKCMKSITVEDVMISVDKCIKK